MSTPFHNSVSLRGYGFEEFNLTVKLAAAITATDVGKALTWDATAANTMKLAGSTDPVIARLEVFEDRTQDGVKVGTAAFKFAAALPIASGETVSVGDTVVGHADGEVTAAVAADYQANYVAEVVGSNAIVVKL